jgi:integrase
MVSEITETRDQDQIVKGNTRILTPDLYAKFRSELNPVYQAIADVQINSGMRWEEFWQFIKHPDWYKASRRCISLNKSAIKKEKCRIKERDVILTQRGCDAVELLQKLKIKKVTRHAVNQAFRLAAQKTIGEDYIMPKMLRKCCATWLMKAFQDHPTKLAIISMSMGHTLQVMQEHYLSTAFATEDTLDMREFFKGWGE